MGRRQTGLELGRCALLILLLIGATSCGMVYLCLSVVFKPSSGIISTTDPLSSNVRGNSEEGEGERKCCRGIEHLELWGEAVKWGSNFKVNSSQECCMACKGMCTGVDGPCLCDSWVYCGNSEACGSRFGECWLKKQKDTLAPDQRDSGDRVIWTSGLVFGKGEGIVGFETDYGILHIKLFPDCAPRSVAYVLELLALHHCAGCHFHRAESRGRLWDLEGNHIENAPFGPPFGLIQGTLESYGSVIKDIPPEEPSTIRRGSVAWVGHGPEFFISLANHNEWKRAHTVFGSVLPEDMEIVEKISQLPSKPDVWSNVNVSVLEKPVPLTVKRIKRSYSN